MTYPATHCHTITTSKTTITTGTIARLICAGFQYARTLRRRRIGHSQFSSIQFGAQASTSALARPDGDMRQGPVPGDGRVTAAVGSNPATATISRGGVDGHAGGSESGCNAGLGALLSESPENPALAGIKLGSRETHPVIAHVSVRGGR